MMSIVDGGLGDVAVDSVVDVVCFTVHDSVRCHVGGNVNGGVCWSWWCYCLLWQSVDGGVAVGDDGETDFYVGVTAIAVDSDGVIILSYFIGSVWKYLIITL